MRKALLPLLLLAEIAVFTHLSGVQFASFTNFVTYFRDYGEDLFAQAAPVLILALGMTTVIMTAGIDLSVGSMVALIACVMAGFEDGPSFWYTAVPVGLFLAVGLGLFNGLLITQLDIPPIIATLGTMIFYRGICHVLMRGLELNPFEDVPGYLSFGEIAGAAAIMTIFVVAGTYFVRSRRRRELLMIGGNRVAARYAGIPVQRRLCEVYALVGLLAFIAALSFTARTGSVKASSFEGLELRVIVAVVLGGTRVEGGFGSIMGTAMGVLLIAVLDEGLRTSAIWGQENLPFDISYLRYVLLGGLLVFGVWLNTHGTKLPRRSLRFRKQETTI